MSPGRLMTSREMIMEINNAASAAYVPMPAVPDTPREPPRNAELTTAVRESEAAEGRGTETRSNDNEQAERQVSSANPALGSFVDVKV